MDDFRQMASPKYSVVKKGYFDQLFTQLANILCFFSKKGIWESVLKIYDIPKGISYKLISTGINLISNCVCDEDFNFTIDFEFYRIINTNSNLSNEDLSELIIAKTTLHYLRTLNVNSFFELMNSLCSNDIRCKIAEQLRNEFKEQCEF